MISHAAKAHEKPDPLWGILVLRKGLSCEEF